MANVTYVEHDGTEHHVSVDDGLSVMKGALNHGIPGIIADCGGAGACATCHIYIDEAWADKLKPMSELEADMLEFASEREPTSRLSCQIVVTDAVEGMIVRIPASQG